jgi:nitroreductase
MSHPKHASTDHDILDLIRQRWSPRAYSPKPVPHAELVRLFEAARWAPSSFNEQPWRFLVIRQEQHPAQWTAVVSTLTPRNQAWAAMAPILVLLAVRETFEKDGSLNPYAWYDAGQAMGILSLQATAQDILIRQMEGFDRDRARVALAIPVEFSPVVLMAMGYAGDPGTLVIDPHRNSEIQPRRRRRVSEFVFEKQWGMGLS